MICRCALRLAEKAADFFHLVWRDRSPGMAA